MGENFHDEQQKKQWEQFQAFQRQQDEQRKSKTKKRWLWGCGGCLIAFVIMIVIFSACTALFTGGVKNLGQDNNKTYKMGETAKNGDLEVQVNSVETANQVGPSVAPSYPKNSYVVVDVSIKNKGKESLTIDSNMFKLKSDDKTFDADSAGSLAANQAETGSIKNSFFLEQVNPDSTAEGKVVFDVSDAVANAKDKKLEISSSLFSSKKVTFDLSDSKKSAKSKGSEDNSNKIDLNGNDEVASNSSINDARIQTSNEQQHIDHVVNPNTKESNNGQKDSSNKTQTEDDPVDPRIVEHNNQQVIELKKQMVEHNMNFDPNSGGDLYNIETGNFVNEE
ncbi:MULTISPECIES: DUF4352 domain-containing protein [Staphylococcus]|uniref:DUF4352 domain-containing protein n=1 Tax=Staphylococcus agnetis TaxID=985762 RepID=A0AAW9YUB3_9STAP|nr:MULTISPECIES: DUF4352 domain-containing protein [Staphylococcus]MBY7665036.1 DUF4352 domain-containing protein [Staphylococcus agnetis]NHM75369.1 DUF4352 domain-containing protein [Staphylococcus sp. 11007852]NHM91259.1 DUF4352 domain-containing protein [Staphylococcus sp. 10602379]NJH83258.1 DUF4352 domain-containing protein [Staphylococcus agnetis]NJI03109.1 DUF4352 domain-containing protein [Staphylococcus agnetis]